MTNRSVAILTDSSCDIPKEYIAEHGVYVLPLQINMPEGPYQDGVDITPDEVYARMPGVIPTTSQPSPGAVKDIFEKIKQDGFTDVLAVCMSSGLSGTHDVIRMCADESKDLTVYVFDSRRLSMALGLQVMHAAELSEKGLPASDIIGALSENRHKTNGYFSIPTLTYLIKGGRIGLVAGTLGTLLGIIPIISINEEGRYFSFSKTRSFSLSIKKMEDTIRNLLTGKDSDIAILHGGALEQAKNLYASLKNIKGLRNIYLCQISPALGVHTGPGLVGVAYRAL